MEQSGTYSKLRHSFENKKAIVKEEAEKWIVRALAKDLLHKTVQRHREEKLPELMTSIAYFLQDLHLACITMSIYQMISSRLSWSDMMEQSFCRRAKSSNLGTTVFIDTTSDYKNINKQVNLPIIMDDSFVHFDHRRTSNTISLLNELKEENQVIYFTCHEHMANSYQSQNMVNLSQINVS